MPQSVSSLHHLAKVAPGIWEEIIRVENVGIPLLVLRLILMILENSMTAIFVFASRTISNFVTNEFMGNAIFGARRDYIKAHIEIIKFGKSYSPHLND